MFRVLILAAAWCLASTNPSFGCEGAKACDFGTRSYNLRVPDTWDGTSPLPVLVHFHGWGREGGLIVQHSRIAIKDIADHVLLVAPSGIAGSWSFRQPGSRDSAFALDVLEDVAKRFPIDRSKIFVSGYSFGANMAWRFACDHGDVLAGMLAVSGTLPQTENCIVAPKEVRQVFGLDDGVLPFPMGPGGDTTYPVALWREKLGCGEGVNQGTWNARPFLTFERTEWTCASGKVVLDVHPGGHFIPHDWIPYQVGEMLGVRTFSPN